MTLGELAKRLKATVPEVLTHYRRIRVDIPEDENYVLSLEQIKRAIPNYKPEEIKIPPEAKTIDNQLQPIELEEIGVSLEESNVPTLNSVAMEFHRFEDELIDVLVEHGFKKEDLNSFMHISEGTYNILKERFSSDRVILKPEIRKLEIKLVGRISLPVDEKDATIEIRKRVKSQLGIIEQNGSEDSSEISVQKKIWKFYIQAKRKFIERLSNQIKIDPSSWNIKENDILSLKIDINVAENELYQLIKSKFSVDGIEPTIVEKDGQLSYFKIPTSKPINQLTLKDFQEISSSYYLDFVPLPAIEGTFFIQNSPLARLHKECHNNGFSLNPDSEGYYALTQREIDVITNFLNTNSFTDVKLTDLTEEASKVIIEDLEIESRLNQALKNLKFESIIHPYNRLEIKKTFLKWSLVNELGLTIERAKVILTISNVQDKEVVENEVKGLRSKLPDIIRGIEKKSSRRSPQLIYEIKFLDPWKKHPYKYQKLIEGQLQNILSSNQCYLEARSVFKYNTRLVRIVYQNKLDVIFDNLKNIYPGVRIKNSDLFDKYFVRLHYRYLDPDSQNLITMRFKGSCEDLAEEYGLKFSLKDEFEIKFYAEINEQLKIFEENHKFQKLRGAEVSVKEKIIGKIYRSNYPNIDVKLNENGIEYFKNIPDEEKSDLDHIKPELKGEIEKISRLEKAIERIEKDSKNLPNPKVAEYIYNSSKATEISKEEELLEGSKTWQEVLFHKNEYSNLNNSQIRGVISSLLAQDLAVIQGPPGTGKSTAIAEIIWQHIRRKQKQKILITSETHLAVDNALEKVGKLKSNLVRPIRFGVEEDDFDLDEMIDENTEISKVEIEGKIYSAKRIDAWMNLDSTSPLNQIVKGNAVQIWMEKIAKESFKEDKSNAELKEKWADSLSNPTSELKALFRKKYLENVNVIGATSSSIAETNIEGKPTKFTYSYCDIFNTRKRKPNIKFDVVITDEASKATPPELLLPLLFAKKSIIVGDHRQLPPLLDENDFASTLKNIGENQLANEFSKSNTNESQFERLFKGLDVNSTLKTTFDIQYRMHSSINEVIQQFYEADGAVLRSGLDPLQENAPDLSNKESRWHGLSSPGFLDENIHCIWVNVEHPEMLEGTSRVNWGEIEACKRILRLLQTSNGFYDFQNHWNRDEDKEIGLISFYAKQLNYLRKMANTLPDIPLRISTVDRFQGMERNIIIVSLVRSNRIKIGKNDLPNLDAYPDTNGFAPQFSLGFAELPNRLNVALSRAKRLLIIVGNIRHFEQKDIYQNVYNSIKASKYGRIIDDYRLLPE